MKIIVVAAALLIAAPALAQTAEPAHKEHDCCKEKDGKRGECCEKKKADGSPMDCCAEHQAAKKEHKEGHHGH